METEWLGTGALDQVLIPVDWNKRQFGMIGEVSNELLSYGGFVLVHDDRAEMEFLFSKGVKRVIPIPPSVKQEECLSIRNHPQISGIIEFPLKRKDFRR